MPQIAVIGAGLIGRSWSIVFARAGLSVNLTDNDPSRLSEAVLAVQQTEAGSTTRLIKPCASIEEAMSGDIALVQECGPELEEVKRALFSALDRIAAPQTILASSSSTIVASRFTSELSGRHRCLIAHPLNPPHLAPIVELCGAPWTSADMIESAGEIYRQAGQVPVVVNREIDGFVLNRLQVALLAEALRLVGDGTISAADLDKTVTEGLGLRWSFLGPFATIELNAPGGIGDYLNRYGKAFQRITADAAGPEVWDHENVERVVRNCNYAPTPAQIAERCAWRDQRLQALREHKQSQTQI
jgi:L-gulonate 3-dehydrogenase